MSSGVGGALGNALKGTAALLTFGSSIPLIGTPGSNRGFLGGGLLGQGAFTKPDLPSAGPGPTAPSLSDAAKQAALDEQKRQQGTSPSPITNIRGASGILTDPNARYVKSQLLGGA